MTAREFVVWAEGTFGMYTPGMRNEVTTWLQSKDNYFISAMRGIVLTDHPSTYGKPPGVHELDAFKIEAYQKGHTLEAIAKAGTHKAISAEPIETVTEEQAAENARKLKEIMGTLPKKIKAPDKANQNYDSTILTTLVDAPKKELPPDNFEDDVPGEVLTQGGAS